MAIGSFNNQKEKKTMNKELKISAENALAAYNNTDANGRELLEHLFGKEIFAQDIKDKVKTFDDAVAILGNDNQAVIDYYAISDVTCTDDILAFAKLRVIAEALNEGWKPKFNGDECRYYPWFYIYTKKKECRVVGRSCSNASACGGVVYASFDNASSRSHAGHGSRIAFKTRELAEYCGNQFINIWADFLFA